MSIGIPFGKYRLIRRIARGGMAEVFLASQRGPEGFSRTVAIKRILPHLADVTQFVEMFMDEARLATRLTHPNIAHIYEFGRVEQSYFIAMEFIDGIDLTPVLLDGKRRPLPLEHVARLGADVCAALHHAHNLKSEQGQPLGLVHRDISPQNIMISFEGAVKVLDFGIAKAAHHVERTQTGVVRGKFTYMSPEQVMHNPLDGRSDLFCVGIVLFELCTGEALYPRDDAAEAMRRIRDGYLPRPTRLGRPLPPELDRILRKALARDRQRRYRDAAQMQIDLEEYLRSSTLLSTALVLGQHVAKIYGPKDDDAGGTIPRPGQSTAKQHPGTVGLSNGGTEAMDTPSASPATEAVDEDQIVAVNGAAPVPATEALDPAQIIEIDGAAPVPATEALDPAQIIGVETDLPLLAVATDEAPTIALDGVPLPMPPVVPDTDRAASSRPSRRGSGLLLALLLVGIGVIASGIGVGYWLSRPTAATADETPAAPLASISDAAPPVDALPAPSASEGVLLIRTRPVGATAVVDAQPVEGVTPRRKVLEAGTHTVLVTLAGHEPQSQTVRLEPGRTLVLNLTLRSSGPGQVVALRRPDASPTPPRTRPATPPRRPAVKTTPTPPAPRPVRKAYGYLSIATVPWSRVYLDGRQIGMTPLARVRVAAGTHQLRCVNPQGPSATHKLTIQPGKLTKLKLKLTR